MRARVAANGGVPAAHACAVGCNGAAPRRAEDRPRDSLSVGLSTTWGCSRTGPVTALYISLKQATSRPMKK